MFYLDEFEGKRVLKSSLIEGDDVVAFFTTRELSLKAGEREDLIDFVEESKKLICKGLGIPQENLVIPKQTHSDNVAVIRDIPSRLTLDDSLIKNTDALITNEHQIALGLNFADCVPIIFYDPVKKVVASSHAGWKGTVAKIAQKTVKRMIEEFGSNQEDIIALIGPSIGKCCFEVKSEVMDKLKTSTPLTPTLSRKGRGSTEEIFSDSHADLKQINKIQLLASGLKKIDVCEYCTSCSNELFFSYRKEQGNTARHSTVIMLRD